MTGNGKFSLVGVAWSALVIGVLLAVEPSARSPSVIFALVVLLAGWMVAARMSALSSISTLNSHVVNQDTQSVLVRSGEAMTRVSGEAARQVARAQNIFNEAIEKLVASFHGMNVQVQRQQQLGLEVASGGVEGGSVSEFQQFAGKTSDTLRQFVDSVVENSKLAMSLVEMTDRIISQMSEVRGMLGEIEGIAKQTNLLAKSLVLTGW